MLNVFLNALRSCGAVLFACTLIASGASAQNNPIKVGMSLALTGGSAPVGKMVQAAVELWRDDVNGKGGLLGRQIQLIVYDDQSNPSNVPGLYTKLITLDKADLLLGPVATNFVAAAMPVIIQNKKMTISFTATGINRKFKYDKYFSMLPAGTSGDNAFSDGFFEIAARQNPKPQTVAILAADAEFGHSVAQGAREELKKHGFKLIFDRSYPPSTTDFLPVMRAVKAVDADIVYVGAYPPDTAGIVRAANEVGLTPKIFGGAMIGLVVTPIKVSLGPIANGLLIHEAFVRSTKLNFPGLDDLMTRYQAKAPELKTDPAGYSFVPLGYAAPQVLAQAVAATKSLDHDVLAKYIHSNKFSTVVGDMEFGKDGEWSKPRMVLTQFQNVRPNDLLQFKAGENQPVLWPPEYATGKIIYPYADARKK